MRADLSVEPRSLIRGRGCAAARWSSASRTGWSTMAACESIAGVSLKGREKLTSPNWRRRSKAVATPGEHTLSGVRWSCRPLSSWPSCAFWPSLAEAGGAGGYAGQY